MYVCIYLLYICVGTGHLPAKMTTYCRILILQFVTYWYVWRWDTRTPGFKKNSFCGRGVDSIQERGERFFPSFPSFRKREKTMCTWVIQVFFWKKNHVTCRPCGILAYTSTLTLFLRWICRTWDTTLLKRRYCHVSPPPHHRTMDTPLGIRTSGTPIERSSHGCHVCGWHDEHISSDNQDLRTPNSSTFTLKLMIPSHIEDGVCVCVLSGLFSILSLVHTRLTVWESGRVCLSSTYDLTVYPQTTNRISTVPS